MAHKKITALAAAFTVAAVTVGCQTAPKQDTGAFIRQESIRLAEEMDSFAESEEYRKLYTASDFVDEALNELAAGDYSSPKTIYWGKSPETAIFQYLSQDGGKEISGLSQELQDAAMLRLNAAVAAGFINGGYGAETVAATTVVTTGKSYIMPEDWAENILVVLQYEGSYSVLVSFVKSGEGVITSNASFVKNEDRDLRDRLMEILPGLELEAVMGG